MLWKINIVQVFVFHDMLIINRIKLNITLGKKYFEHG